MLNLDRISPEQIQRALARYNCTGPGDAQTIRWLGTMRAAVRVRYAVRFAQLDDELAARGGDEVDRSLAYAIVRAERDADVASQRLEMARRRTRAEYARERADAEAVTERHVRLLELWYSRGGSAPKRRAAIKGSSTALLESMLRDVPGSEAPAAPDDAADLLGDERL